MRQRKLKQRKSKQSKSLAKILTLGIATATFVSSMSVPGGLLAPEKVYAEDAAGETESGVNTCFDRVCISKNNTSSSRL